MRTAKTGFTNALAQGMPPVRDDCPYRLSVVTCSSASIHIAIQRTMFVSDCCLRDNKQLRCTSLSQRSRYDPAHE